MSQSRLHSLQEALVNITIGLVVGFVSQLVVFPLKGIHITLIDNAWICLWFTSIGVIRSYVLRRIYNWFMVRKLKQAAREEKIAERKSKMSFSDVDFYS